MTCFLLFIIREQVIFRYFFKKFSLSQINNIHIFVGEFLKNRTWTGLEQNLGQTEVTKAIEGRKGIASNYEDEIK